jgi:hypothetical protein
MSQYEYQDVTGTAAAMFGGKNHTVSHCNLDENYYGHCWGTFEWTIPELGGKWEGVWGGMHDMLAGVVSYSSIGFGSGGKLEGLQLRYEGANPGGGGRVVFIAKVLAK